MFFVCGLTPEAPILWASGATMHRQCTDICEVETQSEHTDLMSRATIFDVADLAGVSIKTVSRVVNSEPNVRSTTKDKVDRAIAELNYRPSQAARTLASHRT